MSDLEIHIKVDPGDSVSKTKGVDDALKKTEDRALSLTKSVSGTANAFSGLKEIIGFGAVLGGLKAIDDYVNSLHEMEDRVIGLTNKAQKFATDFRSVNEVLEQQTRIAAELHSTAGQVIGVYDAVGDATENLNLSISDQTKLTTALGKSAMLAGESLDSVGNKLMAMSVAFETGGDAAKQMRGFLRDNHDLAVELEETLGMTSRQIIESVKNGKLKYGDFVQAIIKGGDGLNGAFGKIQETNKQWKDQVVEGMERAKVAGEDGFGAIKAGIEAANAAASASKVTFGEWFTDLSRNLARIEDEANAAAEAQRKLIASWDNAKLDDSFGAKIATGITALKNVFEKVKEDGEKAAKVAEKHNELLKERLELAHKLLGTPFHDKSQTVEEIQAMTESPVARAIREGEAERAALKAADERAAQEEMDLEDRVHKHAQESAEAQLKSDREFHEAINKSQTEAAAKRIKEAEEVQKAWGDALGKVGGDFIKAAIDGKQSFAEMTEHMLGDIAKVIIQMAALRMAKQGGSVGIAGSILGGIVGGFATGGHVTVPNDNSPYYLPRAANGWSGMVGGAGGTDSKLFMARVTPGEHVHINTPQQEQMQQAGRMAAAPVNVAVYAAPQERDIVAASGGYDGQRVFVSNQRKLYGRRTR